jgi:hypothetical protein
LKRGERGVGSGEQRDKTRLREMAIGGKRLPDSLLLHYDE